MHTTTACSRTMVVSPHYLASTAGARILAQGGNAFDAAIAISATLAVVYPHMTGLGGDAFWLTYESGEKQVRAYNGSGRSAYAASLGQFSGLDHLPVRGIASALTVPGMADSWGAIHHSYGRLPWRDVLQPAIHYAEYGFPLSGDQYRNTVEHAHVLRACPATAATYLPDGLVPNIGDRFRQRQMGESLKSLALYGSDSFYRGELAHRIVSAISDAGGLLNADDFADHCGNWEEPLSTTYHDYDILQAPPNSQGFTALMALNILEALDLSLVEHGSFAYYHLLIEALKTSFIDRNRELTDPAFHNIPLDRLLSKDYARKLASRISMTQTIDLHSPVLGHDTAYAAVVDQDGNAVSFIQSLYFEFGSAFTAGDTGILLQNRGSFFSLNPAHVNRLAPHKRTFHTLMPAMACRNGQPVILYGTQGGEGQPQTQTAILTRMIDYDMTPQEAVSAPRWVWGRTWGEPTSELKVEDRIAPGVREALHQVGHSVQLRPSLDGITGHAHAIRRDEYGFLHGGADPRSDGAAIGW